MTISPETERWRRYLRCQPVAWASQGWAPEVLVLQVSHSHYRAASRALARQARAWWGSLVRLAQLCTLCERTAPRTLRLD